MLQFNKHKAIHAKLRLTIVNSLQVHFFLTKFFRHYQIEYNDKKGIKEREKGLQ